MTDLSHHDRINLAAMELIAEADKHRSSAKYMLLLTDPQSPLTATAYGPFEEMQALTRADALRATFDDNELADLKVQLISWAPWGEQ